MVCGTVASARGALSLAAGLIGPALADLSALIDRDLRDEDAGGYPFAISCASLMLCGQSRMSWRIPASSTGPAEACTGPVGL